jgi:cytochrome c-type biogenesis protein CcmH
MLFWFTLALLIAVALFVLLRPLIRNAGAEPPRAAYDVAIYRDQLDEISRDVARGVLNDTEAAAARLEIERRLLASQPRNTPDANPGTGLSRRGVRIVAGATLVAVPALALAFYLDLGAPGLPDAPLVQRQTERELRTADGGLDLAKAREMLEAKLTTAPDSLQGWVLLARTDAELNDWPAARTAFDKVLALSNRSPEMLEAYGDMLVTEAQGEVTPQAEALLQEAVKAKADLYRSRYYLALAKAQRDDIAGAIADWQALLADAPPDAPWAPSVKSAIDAAQRDLAGGGAAPVAPSAEAAAPGRPPAEMAAIMKLPPADRMNAIRGMVDGLAARLAQDPNDLDGWKRLARSYRVLGDPQKSADAYAKAAALAPDDMSLLVGQADALQAGLPEDAPISPAAAELYRNVLARQPDQQDALWYLGLAEKQAGNNAAAQADWQRLLAQLKPDTPQAKSVQQQLDGLGQAKK